MCGISVLFQKQRLSSNLLSEFIVSLRIINHRGPDDEGVVLINTHTNDFKILKTELTHPGVAEQYDISAVEAENYNLILGHKRLSIVDLSILGHQPMRGHDGSWIVFNGEIYNYIELKEELKLLGCHFKTHTDTEVILEAYRVWGKDCLNKFNGMWSICIWDAPNKKLFINNDRFGVKPFYYFENETGFNLVSETKQLKAFSNSKLALNNDHIKTFMDFGYVDVDQTTMYNDVYRFKKAHYIFVDPLSYQKHYLKDCQDQYYRIPQVKKPVSEKDAINQFRDLLYNSVKIRMRADVDFGFALSGGIDSSAILYTARNIIKNEKSGNELLGFSAIFPGYEAADESKFVKIVSADLPCKTIYSHPMDDFNFDAFERHIYHQDEPVWGTTFFAQWSIYQKMQETGLKILLNGQGADEVFAGYHHHFYRYCRHLLMNGKLPEYFSLVSQYAELKGLSKKYIHQTVFNEIKLKAKMKLGISKFDSALLKYWNKIDTLDEMLVRDFDTFQIPVFLRVDDRNSMAFSIESRHPFMDYRLVEFGYSLPNNLLIKNGWQKYIVRESMHEMPESIRYRKDKKGFTTPHQVWLEKYKDNFESYLAYTKATLGLSAPSKDPYKNYVIGAWLKVNGY
jgi:asparagine synthase (glutamine-hydrolysing)